MNHDQKEELALGKIEQELIQKRNQLKEELLTIKNNDPVVAFAEIASEPIEVGTDSWQAEVHAKSMATKQNLMLMYEKVEQALEKIKNGSYGKCSHCGQNIEPERLRALPTAESCKFCS